jgi:hypothetical protein
MSPPGQCLFCATPEHDDDKLLPHGTIPTGLAWLHVSCSNEWRTNRKGNAVAELAALGIRIQTTAQMKDEPWSPNVDGSQS